MTGDDHHIRHHRHADPRHGGGQLHQSCNRTGGQRAREVALRKVLGATRRQLIVQFVAESILISAVAMLLALTLVELLVRPFAAFLDADLALNYFGGAMASCCRHSA